MARPQKVNEFQIIDTVNPNEEAFYTELDQEVLSRLRSDEYPVYPDTLYQDWIAAIPERKTQWGNYRYLYKKFSPEGILQFYWGKVKTDAQKNTPFDTTTITEEVSWPAVLEWIQFGQESGFPLSQNYISGSGEQALVVAPRWLVQYGYRPGMTLTTRVTVEKFLSDLPFPEWAFESDQPQPTEVSWDLIGSHGSIPRCLHPEVIVPAQSSGFRVVSTAGNLESSSSTAPGGQSFPRTNHLTWQDYIVTRVREIDGQFYRERRLYEAPNLPRITQKRG